MIVFKPTVNPRNVHPAVWVAVGLAYCRHRVISGADMVVTSMNDGEHMKGSLHYASSSPDGLCRAADLRTLDLVKSNRELWAKQVKAALDPLGFDIVLHDGSDGVVEHLHMEFQPKNESEAEWMKALEAPHGPNAKESATNIA